MTLTPSWLPDGTVYGTLLNFRHERELWTVRALEAPYKAPPQAPVLYIKTANTFSCGGAAITLPDGVPEVEIGASLGLVFGHFEYFCHKPSVKWSHSAINKEVFSNLSGVAGCVLLNDLSIPHASYYRPPVKFKCLDGFLGIGPQCLPLASVGDVNALKLDIRINGVLCQIVDFTGLARNAATLLAVVAEFMTLRPGDVLMLGSDCLADGTRPLARAGDRIEITVPGFAPLVNTLIQEAA